MNVITSVKKTGSAVADRLTLPAFDTAEVIKPLFAVVGVADLAFEQVKDAPADLTVEAKRVQALITEASKAVPAQVMTLPAQAKSLRDAVENKVSDATSKVAEFYANLAVRGEKLVGQVRRQSSTQAAVAETKAAVSKVTDLAKDVANDVEAAGVAVKKAAKASTKAVEDTVSAIV